MSAHQYIFADLEAKKYLAQSPEFSDVDAKKLLACAVCKKILHHPMALNCGHVSCQACLHHDGSFYTCPICKIADPNRNLKIFVALQKFIEEQFLEDCNAGKECQIHGSTEEKQERNDHGADNVHWRFGCDGGGMFPISGLRYTCQECVEKVGFDLCESCYKASYNLPGRFNQRHTAEHRFKAIKAPVGDDN